MSWLRGKKKDNEEGSHKPSWLDEDEPSAAPVANDADVEDDIGETSPLVAADDDDGGYGGISTSSGAPSDDDDDEKGLLPGVARSRDEESAVSWHEDEPSAKSSSGRPKLSSGKKKPESTRSRMNEYKAKLETRRRKMLSGLPRRNCCHAIFIFLNIVAVAACLIMIMSQVIPLFFVEQRLLQIVLRGYISFFCLTFIVAEMELPLPFIRSSQSLHNFISKGFNYTFLAIVGMEQAQADLVEETVRKRSSDPMGIEWGWFTALFVEVPAWIMLGVGIIYMVFGVFCLRPVRDRCREDYARRMEEYFEAREAEKKSLKLVTIDIEG